MEALVAVLLLAQGPIEGDPPELPASLVLGPVVWPISLESIGMALLVSGSAFVVVLLGLLIAFKLMSRFAFRAVEAAGFEDWTQEEMDANVEDQVRWAQEQDRAVQQAHLKARLKAKFGR